MEPRIAVSSLLNTDIFLSVAVYGAYTIHMYRYVYVHITCSVKGPHTSLYNYAHVINVHVHV